jgi:hypothetical protein
MKTRTFEEVWCDLERLKGKTVYTLVHHVRSDIIDVDSSGMMRRSERWKQVRHVDRSAFQRTWEKLSIHGCRRLSDAWKFVCACIALLPEVQYSLKPVTIWLSENRHEFGELVEKI